MRLIFLLKYIFQEGLKGNLGSLLIQYSTLPWWGVRVRGSTAQRAASHLGGDYVASKGGSAPPL